MHLIIFLLQFIRCCNMDCTYQ